MSDDARPLTAEDIPWNGTGPRPTPREPSRTLADVERVFKQWIRDDDLLPTRAVLATYLANTLDGDPVWLMLVGGSGVGKTERLTPLAALPNVVLESSISGAAALLSGTVKKDRVKDATGGILRKFRDGNGVLVLKDFTSVLDMHRDARAEVLAALREVYDGRWDRSVGADGGRTLTWEGHIGVIAGCTTAIDAAHAVMSTMGARFVLMRLSADAGLGKTALDHVGRETSMRQELRTAVRQLLQHPPGQAHPIEPAREALIALAQLAALARSPVDRDHQGEISLVLDPEAPTRLVKMLARLWQAAGLLGLSRADSWALVRRIGLDSIPKLRRIVIDYLRCAAAPATTTDIGEFADHPSRTTRRALEDLTAHHVVRRWAGGDGRADRWELTDQAVTWLGRTLPEMSEHIESEPVSVPSYY